MDSEHRGFRHRPWGRALECVSVTGDQGDTRAECFPTLRPRPGDGKALQPRGLPGSDTGQSVLVRQPSLRSRVGLGAALLDSVRWAVQADGQSLTCAGPGHFKDALSSYKLNLGIRGIGPVTEPGNELSEPV